MNDTVERAIALGRYIVESGDTVRGAAKAFCVSKSTVHTDVAKRLRRIDGALWRQCDKVLQHNKDERHLRGGEATKEKYLRLKSGE